MFGVDLGAKGSVILVVKKKAVVGEVIKDKRDKEGFERIKILAHRYVDVLSSLYSHEEGVSKNVAIEEPLYSWGRRNPKVFAKSTMLFALVWFLLEKEGYKIIPVNAKTVKLTAGYGGLDKEGMIRAYIKHNGMEPGSRSKWGQETLADAYFIALAGLGKKP